LYHFWQEERLFSFGFLGFSRWSEKTDGFFIFRGSPAPPCPLQSAPLLRQVQECQQVVAQESEKPWPSAVTTTSARQWSVERLLHGAVVRENRHRSRVAPPHGTANARQAKAAMPPAPAQPQKGSTRRGWAPIFGKSFSSPAPAANPPAKRQNRPVRYRPERRQAAAASCASRRSAWYYKKARHSFEGRAGQFKNTGRQ